MKRVKIFSIIGLVLTLMVFNYIFADEVELNSPNYAVYKADNLELLIGKNEDKKISIASITKLMTAVVAIDNIEDVNKTQVIDTSVYSNILDPELSIAGLQYGQELSYYDLLATMLIPSGADSALYLACTTFGDYDTFIAKMNEKAEELDMKDTHFANPTGLDDEENYSTLNDVAKLLKYVINNQTLKEIISLNRYTTTDEKLTVSGTIYKSMSNYGLERKHIKGGKTGTTEEAGICLASYSVDDDGTELITIVTGASMFSSFPYNISDTEKIDGYVIDNYSIQDILTTQDSLLTLKTYCTKEDEVTFHPEENIKYYISQLDKDKIKVIYSGIDTLSTKNKVGDKLGEAKIYYDNVLIDTVDVVLKDELHFSIIKWIKAHKEQVIFGSLAFVCILVLVITFVTLKKRK